MLFSSVASLALLSYVSADAYSDVFSQLANIASTDTSAQAAWLAQFATISGGGAASANGDVDYSYSIPSTLNSAEQSMLNAITAGNVAKGSGVSTATATSGDAMESMDMNSSEMSAMTKGSSASSASKTGSSSASKSGSSSASKTGSSSAGSSSSSAGIAGNEAPVFIGAALAGLSVLLL